MTVKIAAISMVKDECDIIEFFIKINSRSVDHIYVIDHGSKDATAEILQRLLAAGYPLTVVRNDTLDYNQSDITTSLLHQVANKDEFDYIVPLDADEFIYCEKSPLSDICATQIKANGCGQMPWATYVPITENFHGNGAPLFENFRMRANEPTQFYKVILSNELAKQCKLTMGNHCALLKGEIVEPVMVTAVLQHVPVRSIEQISAKALIGSHRFSIKPGRLPSEGFHWDLIAQKIRDSQYKLTADDIFDIACRYATDLENKNLARIPIDESAPRIGNPEDTAEHHDLSRITLLKNFDALSTLLCVEIKKLRAHKTELETSRFYIPRLQNIFKYILNK